MARFFNRAQKAVLFLTADGKCERCGSDLTAGWHADHRDPWARGGITDVINGQALCQNCNLKKGSTVTKPPRIWQKRATEAFHSRAAEYRDFLVSATPGAGKTQFALDLAKNLLDQQVVERVVVIVPSDNLREQWADKAAECGLQLMPVSVADDYDKAGYKGCIATYQQLLHEGGGALRKSTRRRTLVILDEIHHAGDNRSWGDSLKNAVEHASYRIALTGTPWRRDTQSPIPFVTYDDAGTVIVDYAYEYGEAVRDEVCRSIEFHSYDGEARWTDRTRAYREKYDMAAVNVEYSARIGADMDEDDVSAALDALYAPDHLWIPDMLRQADSMLDELREEVPDAAGLVVAERKWHADRYADLIEKRTGVRPPVVISDPARDPGSKLAKAAIDGFRDGTGRWIIAVKMISEGVDIPRLALGVYASKTQTPLFFRQVVGRFVRTRDGEEINARLLIPAVPQLLKHAIEIEEELRHQLDLATAEDEKSSKKSKLEQGEFDFREPLSASEPVFDRAIHRGQQSTPDEIAAAEAELRLRGVPTRYAVNLASLFRDGASQVVSSPVPRKSDVRHVREKMLRAEIKTLVSRVARKADRPFKEVNTDLLRAGQPPRSQASVEQLEETKRVLLRWLAEV